MQFLYILACLTLHLIQEKWFVRKRKIEKKNEFHIPVDRFLAPSHSIKRVNLCFNH